MNDVAEKTGYRCYLTSVDESLAALAPLCEQQYAEMSARLATQGVELSAFNPRYEEYARASRAGYLLVFRLDCDDAPVGYTLIYLTHDMHNRDFIAQEDTVYVLPEHRNGVGRRMMRAVHEELKRRGVKRLNITTGTDLRVSKLLARMGYKHTAHCMTLTF